MKHKVGFWTTLVVGLICWPMEALFAMLGCSILHDRGFALPTPGYGTSFIVVFGFEMLVASATFTKRTLAEMKERP